MHQLQHTKATGGGTIATVDPHEATLKLLNYCRKSDWAGYDPYDALNSRIFNAVPFLQSRLPRLALTQLMKRSPFNLRGLLMVEKTQNPKGLALFLTALLKLNKLDLCDSDLVSGLISRITELRSPRRDYFCWGYSFPWQ